MMKKLLSPWLALFTLVLMISIRLVDPSFVESVRLRFFDTLITAQPINAESSVEIVNIDDATIKEFGQFPFPRDKYKQIIEKLYEREAGLVVFNVFTPDADRFGKDSILQDYLDNVPVILPQTATNDDVGYIWADCIIEDATDKGVFTSLLNAGMVEHGGKGRDAAVNLTDAGFAEYKRIINR